MSGGWDLTRRPSSCLKAEKVNIWENGKIIRITEKEKYVITYETKQKIVRLKSKPFPGGQTLVWMLGYFKEAKLLSES